MSVITMKVIDKKDHPYADALIIYQFEAPNFDPITVIANLENIYNVNDLVDVALIGTKIDGIIIYKNKIRGENSFGMALGKSQNELGTNVSEKYCTDLEEDKFIKWHSIEGFHNVIKKSKKFVKETDLDNFVMDYRAKIKLHGTNAAIQIHKNGDVIAQSRTRVLTSKQDNYGFAEWVENNKEYFSSLATDKNMIIFGEWCGNGIQDVVSISKLDRRVFAVFAIRYGFGENGTSVFNICPKEIEKIVKPHPSIFVLPWFGEVIEMDFDNRDSLLLASDSINKMVEDVEKEDPWVKEQLNIIGPGEGIVMYPYINLKNVDFYSTLMFKAKGEAHRVTKQKKATQLAPEAAKNIKDFAKIVLTEARLNQGLQEGCDGEFDIRKTGLFLKWVGGDIKKECQEELSASNLTWKKVSKYVMSQVRKWYIDGVKTI